MILKCIEPYIDDFKLDHFYICLAVSFSENNKTTEVTVRRDSDGTPVVMDIKRFELVSEEMPFNWGFYYYGEGFSRTQPVEFSGEFWNLYHDGDQGAEQMFEVVYERLIKYYKLYFDGS
ncbi:hypothetical protein [Acinetobacter radioresistens]|uniref:hypothetical protein n=1 Tax=Acinetobacter radioresistens TaxID=40216 RepID=UPI00321495A1